jgi:hypothetical protein
MSNHVYREVPLSSVPIDTRYAVETMLLYAKKELRLKHVDVVFFLPDEDCLNKSEAFEVMESKTPYLGVMRVKRGDRVWVRADLSPHQAAKTAAHELRHIWQVKSGQAKACDLVINTDERALMELPEDDLKWVLKQAESEREAGEQDADAFEEKMFNYLRAVGEL